MRILLVDDHPLVLEAIESRLVKIPDYTVVGRATSGEQAVIEAARLLPDLVLMDVRMPGMGGLAAITQIKSRHPKMAVIILTMSESPDDLLAALQAGAAAYVIKNSNPQLLKDAIRAVLEGASTVPTRLLRDSLLALKPAPAPVPLSDPLSEREQQVLNLLAQGHSNRAIGEALNIVEATVKKHVHNIMVKLSVEDRTQAVIVSLRLGLTHT